MVYIITYSINDSELRLGQIDAEDYLEAREKIDGIFSELTKSSGRSYSVVEIKRLSEIRKFDALA